MAPSSTSHPMPPLANPRQRANDARMPRPAIPTLALLLASLPAQQGKPDLRETLDGQLLETLLPKLASDEPSDVAWGAHLVGHYRLAGATEALRAALRRFRGEKGRQAKLVRLYLLDALLLLEVRLAADKFSFLLDDPLTRVHAFLCAAQDVPGNAELLVGLVKSRAEPGDAVPFAAGGLLVDQLRGREKPADFARHLLQLARADLLVRVKDADSKRSELDQANVRFPQLRYYGLGAGFPALPRCTLRLTQRLSTDRVHVLRAGAGADDEPRRADELVPPAPGGRAHDWAVVYRRDGDQLDKGFMDLHYPDPAIDSQVAARWLERMARHALPSRRLAQDVRFADLTTLRQDVQRLHAELQACGNGLIEDLISAGWLPEGEPRTFVLPVNVEIRDERGDSSIPLPRVDELLGQQDTSPQTTPR